MRAIELFAGVGGFRIGLEKNNIEVIYANEFDRYAADTYDKNFKLVGHSIDRRDITTVTTSDIPDHDLLVGGFPCQAFSVAGKRKGFDETRGTLFFDVARILKDKRPRHLILENVKGLLTHDEGKTFVVILGVLADLGYRVEWMVLNSKNFGVPQNRERIYIVGHLRNECTRQIFPLSESGSGYLEAQGESQGEGERFWGNDPRGIAGTLRVGGGSTGNLVANTLAQRDYKGGNNLVQLTETRTEVAKQIRREYQRQGRDYSPRRGKALVPRNDYIANTIPTSPSKEQLLTDFKRVRRLTPTECERLQGFPDGWTEGVSDTQRYKQMGNAVTTNVVEAVAGQLLAVCYS